MDERRARAEAAERFRDRARVVSDCRALARVGERRLRWGLFLDELRQDFAYGLRQLARAPSFTAVALLTLAVGLGATTAIWSVVQSVVLRRFPFAHPERVVLVNEVWKAGASDFSAGNFVDLGAASGNFDALTAIQLSALNLSGGDQPVRVLAARATAGFFEVFGVRPLLGRSFGRGEDQPGRDGVVVISHALWVGRFGADPAILERSLHLSGRLFKIIGVMPAGFDPTLSHEEVWLPLAFTPAQRAQHDDHYLTVVGLLRPGVSRAAAQAELAVALRVLAQRFPEGNLGRRGARVSALAEQLIGAYRQRLLVLLGAVGLVLLIACANVASLLLARGSARARELAIRAAIGAGGRRILRQLLTESAVLALAGGALGVGLAALAIRLFVKIAPPGIPRFGDTRVDGGVLLFALGVSVACGLLFGTAPALRAARQDPHALLRGGATGGSGPVRDRLRSSLVLAEIALALTLLMGAGLLLRSAFHLERVPAGFETRGLMTARLTLPEAVYPRPEAVAQTFEQVVQRLAETPGVHAAAAVSAAPLNPGGTNGLLPEGRPLAPENLIVASLHLVTPSYFATLRIPLLAGRLFSQSDAAGNPLVVIVSRELARRTWGEVDPIGKRIDCCEDAAERRAKTVVGVVGDVRTYGPASAVRPEFYLPAAQAPADSWVWIQRTMTLAARGAAPRLLAGAMRSAVRSVDPTLPLAALTTMEETFRGSLAEARFHTLLLLCLGLLGLLLAAVGIYGVIAYFVSLRTREIGIRIALGATRERILALLAWQGAPPLAGGLLLGAAGALGATRWLSGSLYGVTPTDPPTFACVILLLLATGLLAILVPARRATRVDPTRAIQEG